MKLHLPSSLRKALLACISALAAHALPVTVSTGTFAASGALISFLSTQQSIAAEDDEDDEDAGIAPFAIEGDWASGHQVDSAEAWTSFFATSGLNAAGEKVAIDTSSVSGGIDLGSTARTIAADMWIEKFEIASLGANLTFSGAVYGAGDLTTAAGVTGRTFTINGDWSHFTGNINVGSNTLSVSAGKTLSGNEVRGRMFQLAAQANNVVVSVNEMHFEYIDFGNPSSVTFNAGSNGKSNIFFSSAANAVSTIRNSATVTLNNGVTLTVRDTTTAAFGVYNSGRVVLNSGSKWVVETTGSIASNTSTWTVNSGATLDIKGTFDGSSTISLGGTLNVSGNAAIATITGDGSITLSGSGVLSVANAWSFGSGSVTMNGGTLNINGATNTIGTLSGESGTVALGQNSSLSFSNANGAYSGNWSLAAGSRLCLQSGVLDGTTLLSMGAGSAIVLGSTDAHLDFSGVGSAIDNLQILLGFNPYALTGVSSYIVFESDVPDWFKNSWKDYFDFGDTSADRFSFENGVLSWTAIDRDATEVAWDGGNMTWTTGADGWTVKDSNDNHFINGDTVTFLGSSDGGTGEGTITLGGNVTVNGMTVEGDYTFVFGDHTLTVGDSAITIRSGATLTIDGADKYSKITAGEGIEIERGGTLTLKLAAGNNNVNSFLSNISVIGESTDGFATLEIRREGNGGTGTANPSFSITDKNLRVRLYTETVGNNQYWGEYANLNLLTEVGLVRVETSLNGTNNVIGRITAIEGEDGKLVLEANAALTLGGEEWGDSVINNYLDMRNNTHLTLGSNLTLNGLTQNSAANSGQSIEATRNVNLTINTGASNYTTFKGSVDLMGGTLTKQGAGSQAILGGLTAGAVNINAGSLILSGDLEISGKLTAAAGTGLVLRGEQVVFYQNGTNAYTGSELNPVHVDLEGAWLSVVNDSVITLGSDLDVSGVSCSGYDSNNTRGTIQAADGQEVRLTIHGGTGNTTGMHSNSLTLGEGVTLVMVEKTGTDNVQKLQGATIRGNVEINSGTLNLTWSNSSIGGSLSGSGGTLKVDSGANLTLTGGGKYSGELSITGTADNNAGHVGKSSLILGADLEVGKLTANNESRNAVTVADTVQAGDKVKLIVNSNDNVDFGANHLTLEDGIELVKKGTGTWTLTSGLVISDSLRVEQGTVALNIQNQTKGYNVTLDGGTLAFTYEQDATHQASSLSFGDLTMGTNGGTLNLGTQATDNTHRNVVFDSLTGAGNLTVSPLQAGENASHYQRLVFNTIEDYTGTVSMSGTPGAHSYIRIGTVTQTKASHVAEFTAGVYSENFRFQGAGSLTLTSLTVGGGDSGKLYMNYDGTLNITDISLEEQITLIYTYAGTSQSKVIYLDYEDVYNKELKLDITGVNSDFLDDGISLGIQVSGVDSLPDLPDIAEMFDLYGMDGEWHLENRDGVLYLVAGELELLDSPWDVNWGAAGTSGAPDSMTGESLTIGSATAGNAHIEALAARSKKAGEVYLHGGGGKYAIVLGGALYNSETAAGILQNKDSWIRMDDGTYHILAGGSSCLKFTEDTEAAQAAGGFFGDSHIQVEGGTVDYIVGGNHVNNSSFTFTGDSYISVMEGATVNGGIVGGSTLTKGSNNDKVYAFEGNSHIFIYTVLGNPKNEMIGMWDGTESAGDGDDTDTMHGAAFTAIVGGNAWIDRAAASVGTGMNPTFYGNSNITIDLSDYDLGGSYMPANFAKDIVGGNYTATKLSGTDAANPRNSTFEGKLASIEITSNMGAYSWDVFFTGTINGASRRASTGVGTTIFHADTSITINGGAFVAPIAGGFYFEESADGDHLADLTGNTLVTINDGSVWRVVGGSYSMGGGAGSAEDMTGDSKVVINGGQFSNADYKLAIMYGFFPDLPYAGQESYAFIAGGDFYRNNAGHHTHNGSALVEIYGGVFGADDNIHIVGGDYANFATSGNTDAPSTTITKNTGILVENKSGEDLTIDGILVGGSFLTDIGTGGSIIIGGTSSVTFKSGSLTRELPDVYGELHHDHNGIAIVSGSMLVDLGESEQSGDHVLQTSNTEVTVEGGKILGHIVGGHYTTSSKGQNTLTISGSTTIVISGGTIGSTTVKSNIIGGHYSANTTSPDELNLGAVNISVEGNATIHGDIIGGSWREATAALETTAGDLQNKGAVRIELTSGTLDGNVWAAGYHVNDAALTAHTKSTEVVIGSGFTFADGNHTISGGYYKGASDKSTVGTATLVFDDETYKNLGSLTFKDFSGIKVAKANIDLSDKEFTTEFATLTKTGAGTLTLGALSYTGGTQDHNLGLTVSEGAVVLKSATTLGAVQIANGTTLTLDGVGGTMGDLSLSGDLKLGTGSGNAAPLTLTITGELNVTTGTGGQGRLVVDSTGLDADTALVAFTAVNATLGSKLLVDLTDWNLELDAEVATEHRYHLFDNLGLGGADWTQYLEFTIDDAEGWKIDYKDGFLMLTYQEYHDKWVWEGEQNQTWSDTDAGDWTQDGKPEGKNVYFTKDGEQQDQVLIDEDGVTPNAVYVEGGSYTFTSDGDKGLNVTEGIVVGGLGYEAELELKLANTSVPKVTLEQKGTLTVSHEEALQIEDDGATKATQIIFKGGTLAYGKTTGGTYVTADLSTLVSESSTANVRIRVGTTGLAAAALDDPAPVVWGNAAATTDDNEGIHRALMVGLEKTGTDALVVEWAAQDDETYEAKTEALEGTLTFKMHADDGVTATLGRTVTLAGGATVEYTAVGGGTMVIADSYVGVDGEVGKVVIGAAEEDATALPHYELSGDRSSFAGTLELRGDSDEASVDVASVAALGGEDTSLVLNGRAINLAEGGIVNAASIEVTDDTVNKLSGDAAITLTTDSLTGGGVLTTDGEHGIAATDISGFTGTLVAGDAKAVWTLTGTDASIGATLAGNGTITFNYSDGVVLTGAVGNATYGTGTSLENAGEGELVIRIAEASALSSGALITSATAGDIRLGDAEGTGFWAGSSISGDGAFVLTNGTLLNAITAKGADAMLNVETTKYGTGGSTVDAGGTSGQLFNNITLVADSLLKGVADGITVSDTGSKLWLQFGKNNVSAGGTTGSHMIEFTDTASKLNITSTNSDRFVLDFSTSGLVSLLEQMVDGDGAYLHVTNGTLNLDESLWEDVMGTKGNGYMQLLSALGMEIDEVVSGKIHLIGDVNDVYLVLDEDSGKGMNHEVKGYGTLDVYKATVVAEGEELTLTLTGSVDAPDSGATERERELGGGVINNLVGVEDSSLRLKNGDTTQGRVTVVLNNEAEYPDLQPEEARGIDTTFMGTITAEEGVDLKKAGKGTLSIGSAETGQGGLKASGDVVLAEGSIVLQGGSDNSINALVFNYTTPAAADEKRGLTLTNGTKTSITTITESSSAAYSGTDNHIILTKEAELVLTEGSNELRTTRFTGGDGTGVLTVGQDAQLTLTGGPNSQQLDNVHLKLASDSLLDLRNSTQNSVNSFSGKGTLRGYESSVLTITGSNGEPFSGELAGDGMGMGLGGGTLNVAAKGRLILDNVTTSVSAAWSLVNSGDLTIDVSGNRSYTYFQDITLAAGSKTTYRLDTDYAGSIFKADSFTVESPAEFIIESTGRGQLIENDGWVTLAQVGKSANDKALHSLDITLQGVPFLHYEAADLRIRQEKLQLQVREITENRFELPNMEKNARAGATLFWAASSPESAAWDRMSEDENSDLYKVTSALAALYYSGDEAAMSRTLAAGAGASVSVLGSALAHDIQRQLGTIRNRTTTMAAEPSYEVYDSSEQIYHMWINAEGSNFKTKANSLAPGYSLSSWGGTVGIDTDWDRNTTIGLAISAMYGDLKPEAADRATGNLDTTYLTAFARHASGAWLHTFIVSGGVADVTLNRTVDHALGSYKTLGNTSGFALGALYEVGYAHVMNTEGTFILQTVFNTQITHATISGYTESGSDAGLRVGDISHDVVTFGLGARAQAIVGENAYNRTSILEARALVKLDAGDRSGTATNALVNGANVQAEVESARVGAVGVELGAGLTVPLGASSGSVFVDTSLEVRSGYTGLNATAGYRFSF